MDYPPDLKYAGKIFRELQKLDEELPAQYDARKYEIIHDLAEANFFEAREYFIEGLSSEDPDYRWSCVSALVTHWQDEDPRIVEKLIDMSKSDPDVIVRDISISSLGVLRYTEAMPLLKELILDITEDLNLRRAAYISILRILDQPEDLIHDLAVAGQFTEDMIDEELLKSI